jgi:uncharacterized Zn finger protein
LSETAHTAPWSQRLLDSLNAIGFGPTRRPGRRNQHAGQVLSFSLSKSMVIGLLHGTGDEAYRARIAVRAFSGRDWGRIERELSRQTRYAAKLLSGDLPMDIEDVFDALDLPLFPRTTRDIAMDCSCPDWQVPCNHLSIMCHLLAEMFDADPFQILVWRGRDRVDLLERLVSLRTGNGHPDRQTGSATTSPGSRPLAECLDSFWGTQRTAAPTAAPIAESVRKPDLLLDQMPPPDLMRDGQLIADLLRPLYRTITEPRP